MKSQRGLAVRVTVRFESYDPAAYRAGECAHRIIVAHNSNQWCFQVERAAQSSDSRQPGSAADKNSVVARTTRASGSS